MAMQRVEIRIKGMLDASWSNWFEGFEVRTTDGETILAGQAPDQAALYGLIGKLRDLGIQLISVNYLGDP
jgi:hypothetical protein